MAAVWCCISTCTVVTFPCEYMYGNMLWKTRRFNMCMQLMDDACSWCRWPSCSMRGLPLETPFDILGHRECRRGAVLGPLAARPMASARRTPPMGGCQVHCVPAHARRERIDHPWRFPQTDRSSSVSQFRCLTVYPCQKTPIIWYVCWYLCW
jgi:hypothetical protein